MRIETGHFFRWVALLGMGSLLLSLHLAAAHAHDVKRDVALAQLSKWADWFEITRTQQGTYPYFYFPDLFLPDLDPWGHHLMVVYTQGRNQEAITVRSAGGDGEYFTMDDVMVERSIRRPQAFPLPDEEN